MQRQYHKQKSMSKLLNFHCFTCMCMIIVNKLPQTPSLKDCPFAQNITGSEKFSDCSSGTNSVPFMVRLRTPISTALLISLLKFLANSTPAKPASILLCLSSSTPVLLPRITAKGELLHDKLVAKARFNKQRAYKRAIIPSQKNDRGPSKDLSLISIEVDFLKIFCKIALATACMPAIIKFNCYNLYHWNLTFSYWPTWSIFIYSKAVLSKIYCSSRIAGNVAPEVNVGFEFECITYCTNAIWDWDQMKTCYVLLIHRNILSPVRFHHFNHYYGKKLLLYI